MSSSRSPAVRALLVALPAVAALASQGSALCEEPAALLDKLASSSAATYQARELVAYLGEPQSVAVVEVRSSPSGRFLRSEGSGDVTRVWRSDKRGVVSAQGVALEHPVPPSVPLKTADVLAKYDVSVGAPERVLGVELTPLELVRRSDGRLVERIFVHRENGVMYRRELLDDDGDLIGIVTVLDMRWGESDREEPYEGATPKKVRRADIPGVPRSMPYDYRLIGSYRIDAGGRDAVHWLYTDGLHGLSVFRTSGRLKRPDGAPKVDLDGTSGWTGPGPGTWMWEGGRSVWSLVAEEPQLDPRVLTDPLPQGGPSIGSRLGSWWARAYRSVRDRLF